MYINEVYGTMNKCQTCIFAIWDKDIIIGCERDDCNGGVVLYDD